MLGDQGQNLDNPGHISSRITSLCPCLLNICISRSPCTNKHIISLFATRNTLFFVLPLTTFSWILRALLAVAVPSVVWRYFEFGVENLGTRTAPMQEVSYAIIVRYLSDMRAKREVVGGGECSGDCVVERLHRTFPKSAWNNVILDETWLHHLGVRKLASCAPVYLPSMFRVQVENVYSRLMI